MKRIGKNFWASGEAASVFETDSVEEISVHAHLAAAINELNPKTLLDFGCGDGPLIPMLNDSIKISLHDINPISLQRAISRCQSKHPAIPHESSQSIPEGYFDVVVLSFVIVCLSGLSEFSDVLRAIYRSMACGGKLIIADTHPCFRDRDFVGHSVGYTEEHSFNYNARFHEFPVNLHGPTRDFEFYDFHWTISDLLNSLLGHGFELESVNELNDVDFNSKKANKNFPPYILLKLKKSEHDEK